MTSQTTISRTKDRKYEAKLAEYINVIEGVARRIAAESRSQHYGAEYDDLVQEGRIALWTMPAKYNADDDSREGFIERWMYDYVNFLGKQRGAARDSDQEYGLLRS